MDSITAGQIATRSITLTQEHVEKYTEAEVLSVHDSNPVTQLAISIKRHDGETVLEGEAWCYTFSPEK